MTLPNLRRPSGKRRLKQYRFGGLDRRTSAGDGAIYEMRNLSTDDYPTLSVRKPRYWNTLCQCRPQGFVFDNDGRCYTVREGDLYRDGELLLRDFLYGSGQDVQMILMNGYVVTYPCIAFYEIDGTHRHGQHRSDAVRYASGPDWYCFDAVSATVTVDAGHTTGMRYFDNFFVGQRVSITLEDGYHGHESQVTGKIVRICNTQSEVSVTLDTEFTPDAYRRMEIKGLGQDLDRVFVHENRVWGYKGSTVFASALGSFSDFETFEGLSTDAWQWENRPEEPFTGCISYAGYPTFFTPGTVLRVFGDYPAQFSVGTDPIPGIKRGLGDTLAAVGGRLLYVSDVGVMAYSGGQPTCISPQLGDIVSSRGVAGTDGVRYYLTLAAERPGTEEYTSYVYRDGRWAKEDVTTDETIGYAYANAVFHRLVFHDGGEVLTVDIRSEGGTKEGSYAWREAYSAEFDDPTFWFFETADLCEPSGATSCPEPAKKRLFRLLVRLESTAPVRFYVQYDTSADWILARAVGQTAKRTFVIPMIAQRSDRYRLRVEGTGETKIYELTRESRVGSYLKSEAGIQ